MSWEWVALVAVSLAAIVALARPYILSRTEAEARKAALASVNERLEALEAREMSRQQGRFPAGLPRRAG